MKAWMIALSTLSLACTSTPPEDEVPVQGEGACDAAEAQKLIGRSRSAELGTEAKRLTGARTLRWITPGMAVTMDYREDRLNIHLDGNNKVLRINCG